MRDSILDKSATVDDICACLDENGYAVIRELADADTMNSLNAEFDPYMERIQLGRTDFAGYHTKRINNLIAKSTTCQELAIHPLVMQVCDRVLLPYCARYHLHITALIELQPGERPQVLHRDGNIYPLRAEIPTTLATIWACNDFTAANGGTSIVPGSHLWPHDRQPEPHEIISTEMPRGSVLIYTSNVIHGGGGNSSNGTRRGMALHYNLGWLRQEENQYLSLPVEIARTLPEPVQKLVGYDLGAPYLGFVEAGNPLVLLHDDRAHDMARSSPELAEAMKHLRPIYLTERAGDPSPAPHIPA